MTDFVYKIGNGTAIYRGRILNSVKRRGEVVIGDFTNYKRMYFTIESLEDDNEVYFTKGSNAPNITFYYSLDNGVSWRTFQSTMGWAMDEGDKVILKASCTSLGAINSEYGFRFSSTKKYIVYGNILSLMYEDNFVNKVKFSNYTDDNQFAGLFYNSINLVDASNLIMPVTELDSFCYSYMFYNCSSLTGAPVLIATTLAGYCYWCMFAGCSSLNKITCYATDRSAQRALDSWVDGVSATGDFYKTDSSWTDTGTSSIPAGWNQHNI